MGMNKKGACYSCSSGSIGNDKCGDTTLRLDCLGYGNRGSSHTSMTMDDGCRLVLGLGPTPMAYSEPKQGKGSCSSSLSGLPDNGDSVFKLGLFGETGNLFRSLEFSSLTQTDINAAPSYAMSVASNVTSCSVGTIPEHSATVTSVNRPHNTKRCRFMGCTKGARGASGLCIGHGGGQRCLKPGCNKGAESRSAYCKAHGGGRRCQNLGCTKSADGKTEYCIAHGGGRRCSYEGGCSKAARGKSGFCIGHGGGKRCKVEGCRRSAEGRVGVCISHGGGRRCQAHKCTKGAQGSTMYCKAHGGGKRCIFAGCTKGAEGRTPLCKAHGGGKRCMFDGGGICPKSVHGGTGFCVAHGGGKRCSVPACTKSARGRTDCCVRHGGGKRCKLLNCGKSAQGSTDFCKAHGGGKRCSWGNGTCQKFARGRSGLCAAHTSMFQETENKRGMIGPGLFQGLVWNASSPVGSPIISDCGDSLGRLAKRQDLIPPEVLVPLSMKSTSIQTISDEKERGSFEFLIPEGRVHGGRLMSLLGGNLNNAM